MRKKEAWRKQARDAAFAYPRLRRELEELRRKDGIVISWRVEI